MTLSTVIFSFIAFNRGCSTVTHIILYDSPCSGVILHQFPRSDSFVCMSNIENSVLIQTCFDSSLCSTHVQVLLLYGLHHVSPPKSPRMNQSSGNGTIDPIML